MEDKNINFICKRLLSVDWAPKLSESANNLINKCDSILEVQFLFGALFFLEQLCIKEGNMSFGDFPLDTSTVTYQGKKLEGYFSFGVWPLWISELGLDCGPQSIMFVPQTPFADKYHHDFGIFYGDKYGRAESWDFQYGVEIDGYMYHHYRREKDKFRDSIVNYPVFRLLEEESDPLTWFRMVMKEDEKIFYDRFDDQS